MSDLTITCSRCNSTLHHECHPETLEEAALDLFMWRPEDGFPKAMKNGNDYCDGSEDKETVAFLTEAFLYPLLGKEDARSLMARVHALFQAMGVEPRDFEEKAWQLLDQKKRDKEAEAKARVERQRLYRKNMRPITSVKSMGQGDFTICQYRSFYCFDVNVAQCSRGECFEREDEDFRVERKKPKLGAVVWNGESLEVTCGLCKRTHSATPDQVKNWRTEKRYPTRVLEEGRRGPSKPEHWIRAAVIFTALGFKDEPSEQRAARG